MNSKVRDFFKRETSEIVSISNFDQVFNVLEQLIQYDVNVPELEGIRKMNI